MPQRSRTASAKAPEAGDVLVGCNIRLRRLSRGMSQAELGRRLGVSFQQVQKYEKGANRVGSGRLLRIAGVFKLPVAAFYEGAVQAANGKPSALRLVAERQPLRLVRAFARIRSRAVRRTIVVLVERVAETDGRD